MRQVVRSAERSYTEIRVFRSYPDMLKSEQLVAQASDGTLFAIDDDADLEEAKALSLRFFIQGDNLSDLF